jgi:hypothetical protein
MAGMDDAPMAGMDDAPMAGMDDGSMPGMTHESAPAAGSGVMPGMPGMADSHQDAAPVSRPVAWVVGAFVVVNGLMMAAAVVLRRRNPGRRAPRRPRPVAA